MSGQAWLFSATILVGAAIGLLYDIFRIFRKTAPHTGLAVQLEDLLFWLTATGLTFYYMLHRNSGEIRPFALLGIGLGLVLYFATISRLVLVVFVSVVNYIKKVVAVVIKILLVPVKYIASLLAIPLGFAATAARKQGRKVKRYGKTRIKKTARDWAILRRKV